MEGIRIAVVTVELALGLLLFWKFGRSEEDDVIVERLKAKLGRT